MTKDRQSDTQSHVSNASPREAVARHVGAQVRDAMARKGWLLDDGSGRPDVGRLAEEVGCRWQTAQGWIEGTSPPRPRYAVKLAHALGLSVAELLGATTEEPTSEAWLAFVESPTGQTMTPSERQAIAAMLWPHGPPDATHYRMALQLIRSTRE